MANGTLVRCLLLAICGLSLLGQSGRAADIEVGDTVIIKAEAKPLNGGLRTEFINVTPLGVAQQVNSEYVTIKGARFSRQDVLSIEEAKDFSAKQLEENPNSVDGLVLRSILALADLGDVIKPTAIADIQKAIEIQPENANHYQILATLLSTSKKYDEALKAAEKAIELAPNDGRGYVCRARIYGLGSHFQKSLDDAEKAIELTPELFEGYLYRALAFQYQGMQDEAIKAYATLLRKDYNFALAFEMRASLFNVADDRANALRDINESLRLNPKSYSSLILKANILGIGTADSFAPLNKAIELAPSNPKAYTERGSAYFVHLNLDKAKEDLERAVALLSTDYLTTQWRCAISKFEENYEEAIQWITQFLKDNPEHPKALAERSELYFHLKRYDESIADIDLLLSKNAKISTAYLARGLCYLAKEDVDKATKDFDTGLEIEPLNDDLLIERGKLYTREKNFAKAIECFDKALGASPLNLDAIKARADANAAKGNPVSEALDRVKADAITKYSTQTLERIAYSAFEHQQYFSSYQYYQKITEIDNQHHRAYLAMGAVLMQGRLWQRAEDMYAKTIELTPRNSHAFSGRAALTVYRKGDLSKAIDDCSMAIKYSDTKTRAQYLLQRSSVYRRLKDYDKQFADIRSALKLEPNTPNLLNSLAWNLATCPSDKHRDGKEAVKLATKACELSNWEKWAEIDTLAAAYAEAGDMENAIKTQEQAIELGGDAANVPRVKSRLELFRSGKAYREDTAAQEEEDNHVPPAKQLLPQDE